MKENKVQELFYELILVALGRKERLSKTPSDQEWNSMYEMTVKQAVPGISFLALDKLSQVGQKPPLALLYEMPEGQVSGISLN